MCLFLDCVDGGIDLVFAASDGSGSITSSGFDLIKELVVNISSTLDIGLERSLVGVILFGDTASIEFGVSQHTDEASLLSAINNLQELGQNPPQLEERFKRYYG